MVGDYRFYDAPPRRVRFIFATDKTTSMNAEQLGAGTPSATSDSESSELGSPAASQWGEALTDVQVSAAEAAA
nr:hypothetical protein [Bradyrhizobium zhanjiangense]